ncbi:unnamed protein product [Oikopleura dioica]|uniref:Uncharacterized protein n=1 Tax=Oikopleura dioica TaxID=34765 RepID=E4XJ30_OIKDI|nr:unnamed protein product [Oikopleura dioica]CBY34585.1 unnamed protein product [Oikopleura dioica]
MLRIFHSVHAIEIGKGGTARELIEPTATFQKEEHCALLKQLWPNGEKQHLFFKNSMHFCPVADWNRISLKR